MRGRWESNTLEDVFQLWKVGEDCLQGYTILGYIPLG